EGGGIGRAVVVVADREPVDPDLGERVGDHVADDDREVADGDLLAEVLLQHVALELVRAPTHRELAAATSRLMPAGMSQIPRSIHTGVSTRLKAPFQTSPSDTTTRKTAG